MLPPLQRNLWETGNLKRGDKFYSAMQGGPRVHLKLKLHIHGTQVTHPIGQGRWESQALGVDQPRTMLADGGEMRIKPEPTWHAWSIALLLKEQMTWEKWADPKKGIGVSWAGNPIYLHCVFISAVYLMSFPRSWTWRTILKAFIPRACYTQTLMSPISVYSHYVLFSVSAAIFPVSLSWGTARGLSRHPQSYRRPV